MEEHSQGNIKKKYNNDNQNKIQTNILLSSGGQNFQTY